jgi:hypothetical protein
MKRSVQMSLACLLILVVVSVAVAQQTATPVVRIGDWVEVGNEVFMNIIASTDIRYRTTKDYDFESRIDDRVNSRNNLDTVVHGGEGDIMYAETRLGVDMRYQKSLQMQVLFEQQSIFDGNLIDNGPDNPGCGITGNPPCRTVPAGQQGWPGPEDERNTVNLERFWIDYKFPGTPLRMRVGADLWATDAAGILSDDDPRFAVFYDGNPVKAYAAAVVQTESSRLGLTDDNDYIYYTFGASVDFKPHRFAIDAAYFRDRATGAVGNAQSVFGQRLDTVMVSPSWKGSFGPINALVQGSFQFGTIDGPANAGSPELDVWSWAAVGYLEADLGIVTPFVAFIYGTGDDNPNDRELNGFSIPHREITIMATGFLDTFDTSTSFGERGTAAPARANYAGGAQFRHSVGNPFSDRLGNTAHRNRAGVVMANTTLSNPGVMMPMAGIKTTPLKGHNVDVWWIWTRLDTLETLQASAIQALPTTVIGADRRRYLAAVRDFDENLTHEFSIAYTWTLNPHFDIRLSGNVILPLDGAKAIARTQDCEPSVLGLQSCEGEDIALRGEARFRARF